MIPIRDTIPSRRWPLSTLLIMAANVVIFVKVAQLPPVKAESLYFSLGVIPNRFFVAYEHGNAQAMVANLMTPLSSIFLHGGLVHLAFNMWSFWIFGDNIEDRLGFFRFTFFYVICGYVACAVHVFFNLGSRLPTVGASGAIAGVMGAYAVLYPQARIVTLVPILFWPLFIHIPALIFMGIWFIGQILSGLGTLAAHSSSAADVGGVAVWAHVGGFACGLLLGPWLARSKPASGGPRGVRPASI